MTKLNQKEINRIIRLHNEGFNFSQIAKKTGSTRKTVKKYIRQENQDTVPDEPFIPDFLKEGTGYESPETPQTTEPLVDGDLVEVRDQEMRTLRHKIIAGVTMALGLFWWLA